MVEIPDSIYLIHDFYKWMTFLSSFKMRINFDFRYNWDNRWEHLLRFWCSNTRVIREWVATWRSSQRLDWMLVGSYWYSGCACYWWRFKKTLHAITFGWNYRSRPPGSICRCILLFRNLYVSISDYFRWHNFCSPFSQRIIWNRNPSWFWMRLNNEIHDTNNNNYNNTIKQCIVVKVFTNFTNLWVSYKY